MNNYITFDTLKYMAPHLKYAPIRNKPATERLTLSGASDVTYGPGVILEWTGEIIAPVTPNATGWGDIDDLRYSLEKRTALLLTDHYGNIVTVYAMGPHGETSFTPMWDAASNEFRVSVRFVVNQGGGTIVSLDTLELVASSSMDVVGGERIISMDTLELSATPVHVFTVRPVILQELYLVAVAEMDGISRMVTMDTLTLVGSAETLVVT